MTFPGRGSRRCPSPAAPDRAPWRSCAAADPGIGFLQGLGHLGGLAQHVGRAPTTASASSWCSRLPVQVLHQLQRQHRLVACPRTHRRDLSQPDNLARPPTPLTGDQHITAFLLWIRSQHDRLDHPLGLDRLRQILKGLVRKGGARLRRIRRINSMVDMGQPWFCPALSAASIKAASESIPVMIFFTTAFISLPALRLLCPLALRHTGCPASRRQTRHP